MLPNVLLEGCARRTGTSREASPELGRTKAEKGPGPGGAWLSVKDQAEVGDRFLEKMSLENVRNMVNRDIKHHVIHVQGTKNTPYAWRLGWM